MKIRKLERSVVTTQLRADLLELKLLLGVVSSEGKKARDESNGWANPYDSTGNDETLPAGPPWEGTLAFVAPAQGRGRQQTFLPIVSFDSNGGITLETFASRIVRCDRAEHNELCKASE